MALKDSSVARISKALYFIQFEYLILMHRLVQGVNIDSDLLQTHHSNNISKIE